MHGEKLGIIITKELHFILNSLAPNWTKDELINVRKPGFVRT